MKDLKAKLEQLLLDAADCELIGIRATDSKKRDLFQKLAADLRSMVKDVQAAMCQKLRR